MQNKFECEALGCASSDTNILIQAAGIMQSSHWSAYLEAFQGSGQTG